jgi:predicted dehydrogenase
MTNWRRFAEISGSHILEKCCHDLDLLNWLIDSLPSRVASFGGLDIFTAERADAIDQFEPPPGKASVFTSWETPTRDADDPFRTDKTIIDNQVAIIEYRNGARATFHTSLSNAIPERRMHFGGTDGTLVLEFYSGRLELKRLGHGQPTERYDLGGTGGHGGGDAIIMRELAETMAGEHPPACSGAEGLRSAVAALAIEQARREGRIVNLGETWHRLGQ